MEKQDTLPDMPSVKDTLQSLSRSERFDLQIDLSQKRDELNALLHELDDLSELENW